MLNLQPGRSIGETRIVAAEQLTPIGLTHKHRLDTYPVYSNQKTIDDSKHPVLPITKYRLPTTINQLNKGLLNHWIFLLA